MNFKFPKRKVDYAFVGFIAGIITGFGFSYYFVVLAWSKMKFPKKKLEYVFLAIIAGVIAGFVILALFSSTFELVFSLKASTKSIFEPVYQLSK